MIRKKIFTCMANYLVVLFLLFLFRFIPPLGGVSEVGMQVIGVFAGVIYGWITIGIGWPSVLGIAAFGMTDYMGMTDLLSTAFGSQTMVMIMTLLLLAAFVQQSDLTDLILHFLLSRKSAAGKPFLCFSIFSLQDSLPPYYPIVLPYLLYSLNFLRK